MTATGKTAAPAAVADRARGDELEERRRDRVLRVDPAEHRPDPRTFAERLRSRLRHAERGHNVSTAGSMSSTRTLTVVMRSYMCDPLEE